MILFINLLNCKSDFIFKTQGRKYCVGIYLASRTYSGQSTSSTVCRFIVLFDNGPHALSRGIFQFGSLKVKTLATLTCWVTIMKIINSILQNVLK